MKNNKKIPRTEEARMQLVEAGGQTAQDLGLSRIQGQILMYLYLRDGECSLDQIETSLGLSKAAVSIAARQLETLGFLRRVWKTGDRRRYYRTADNLGKALRDGMLGLFRNKVDQMAGVLSDTARALRGEDPTRDADLEFLLGRIHRADVLCGRAERLLNNRLVRYLTR